MAARYENSYNLLPISSNFCLRSLSLSVYTGRARNNCFSPSSNWAEKHPHTFTYTKYKRPFRTTMLFRLGLRTAARLPRVSLGGVRCLTTETTITDHATGKVIKLTDPAHPEMADYPNPEPELAQNKDPYAKYDFPQLRRNFGDKLNFNDDMYDIWSPDHFLFVSDKTALKHNAIFFSTILAIAAGIYFLELNPEKPAMPRSYPYNGLAKDLGSGSEKTDYFYKVKTDEAANEAGVLSDDADVKAQQTAYEDANAEFIKA